jgi:hypothetical protein
MKFIEVRLGSVEPKSDADLQENQLCQFGRGPFLPGMSIMYCYNSQTTRPYWGRYLTIQNADPSASSGVLSLCEVLVDGMVTWGDVFGWKSS